MMRTVSAFKEEAGEHEFTKTRKSSLCYITGLVGSSALRKYTASSV